MKMKMSWGKDLVYLMAGRSALEENKSLKSILHCQYTMLIFTSCAVLFFQRSNFAESHQDALK
jgi:hypothetical protein